MPRKKQDVEEQDVEDQEQDVDEDELEDEIESQTGSDLSINFTEDTVAIELPRDGNEDKTLKALGKLLEGMS